MTDKNTTEAATALIEHVMRGAFDEIREAHPFLNTDDLSAVLDKARTQLADFLIAKEPAMSAAKDRFAFDKLPAELRVEIYELTLAADEDTTFELHSHQMPSFVSGRSYKKSTFPSLLHVSRQIRHEASPIFYSTRHFTATLHLEYGAVPAAQQWLGMIGQESASQIKQLSVRLLYCGPRHLRETLRELEGLFGRRLGSSLPPYIREDFTNVLQLEKLGVNDGVVKIKYDQGANGE